MKGGTMKRRRFLGLFGAAATTPFLPAPVAAAAGKGAVGYSPAALHAAIYHAKTRAAFSVWGLAKTVGISVDQADALMGDLVKRGIVGPVQGTTFGGRWASSNVLMSDKLGAAVTAKGARVKTRATSPAQSGVPGLEVDLSRLLSHLRQICLRDGLKLAECVA